MANQRWWQQQQQQQQKDGYIHNNDVWGLRRMNDDNNKITDKYTIIRSERRNNDNCDAENEDNKEEIQCGLEWVPLFNLYLNNK